MLFLPIAIGVHLAEEWFGGFLPSVAANLGSDIGVDRFVFINTVGSLIITFGSLAAVRVPGMTWFGLMIASLAALNAGLQGQLFARFLPGERPPSR